MTQETVTIKFNEPLAQRIEAFLEEHPEYGTLEEFILAAARRRKEQLVATLPQGPATGAQARDEDYSDRTLQASWDALNKPLTSEEKTRILKDLATEFRKLKVGHRGIQ